MQRTANDSGSLASLSDDNGASVIANSAKLPFRGMTVLNTGTNAILVSVDGGSTYPIYCPGSFVREVDFQTPGAARVYIKNASAGNNGSNIWIELIQ